MVLSLLSAFTVTSAVAQTWEYLSYRTAGAGVMAGQVSAPGYITLDSSDGKATLSMFAGTMDSCYRGALNAAVTKTDVSTTITVPPRVAGCDEIRFVIRNDGSGGRREVKKGDAWVWDGLQRGLTPKK
jgi:hypothetical protein